MSIKLCTGQPSDSQQVFSPKCQFREYAEEEEASEKGVGRHVNEMERMVLLKAREGSVYTRNRAKCCWGMREKFDPGLLHL